MTHIFSSHLHIVPRTKRFNFCPVVQNAPYGITSSYNDYQAKNQNLTFHGQPVAASETTIKPPSLEFQHQMFWQSYANRFKERRGGSYLPCYTHSHRIIDEWRI